MGFFVLSFPPLPPSFTTALPHLRNRNDDLGRRRRIFIDRCAKGSGGGETANRRRGAAFVGMRRSRRETAAVGIVVVVTRLVVFRPSVLFNFETETPLPRTVFANRRDNNIIHGILRYFIPAEGLEIICNWLTRGKTTNSVRGAQY